MAKKSAKAAKKTTKTATSSRATTQAAPRVVQRAIPRAATPTASPSRTAAMPRSISNGQSGAPNPTGDSLEKVRDILFGTQQRDNDRRFGQLEERLTADLQAMRDDARKRLETLEQYAKAEIAGVVERLKTEQQRATQSIKDLTAQHKEDLKNIDRAHTDAIRQMDKSHTDTMKDLDKRLKTADDASEKRDGQMRTEMLDQSSNLRDELQRSRVEITSMLKASANELHDTKADRALIAELFSEMALRLASEGK